MRVLVYLRWFFVLSLFTACTSNEPPVGITEAEPPATHAPEAHLDVNSLTGKIVYSSEGDVYVINADGSERTRLTDNPAEDFDPVWSPDGTRLAFETNRDGWPTLPDYVPLGYDSGQFGDSEIFIMNIDGSGQMNLTNNPREDDSFPAWSSDGYIVFSRYGCLMVMHDDGSGLAPIGSCEDGGQFPDWYQPVKTSNRSV